MSTWNETFSFITSLLLFLCLLYSCSVRDWYTYHGHCKGANGTHNTITKGIWQACIDPSNEATPSFCYPVLECGDVDNDEWVTDNGVEELTGHAGDIRDYVTLAQIFILLSLFTAGILVLMFFGRMAPASFCSTLEDTFGCSHSLSSSVLDLTKSTSDDLIVGTFLNSFGISVIGNYFIHADRIKNKPRKIFIQTLCSVCSVLTAVLCWCWWCAIWLLIHADARNIYQSTITSWKDFGHDSWKSFGSCFYVGITSMVLVNGGGIIDMILLGRKCNNKCKGRTRGGGGGGREGVGGGGSGEEGGSEDPGGFHTMNDMDIDIVGDGLYNDDTDVLIINM